MLKKNTPLKTKTKQDTIVSNKYIKKDVTFLSFHKIYHQNMHQKQ